jgi:hypothetical protein
MEEAQSLVKKYLSSERRIKRLSKEHDKVVEDYNEQDNKVRAYYDDLESELNKRKSAERDKLEEEKVKKVDEIRAEQDQEHLNIAKVEEILNFFYIKERLERGDFEVFKDQDIKGYRYGGEAFVQVMGTIIETPLLKLVAVINENRKPKNKYTLSIVGLCAFGERELPRPHTYGLDISLNVGSRYFHVASVIAEKPTIEELKPLWEKKNGAISDFLRRYAEIEADYYDTIKTYKKGDFKEVFFWACKSCGLSMTEREYRGNSWRENKCPRCDKIQESKEDGE